MKYKSLLVMTLYHGQSNTAGSSNQHGTNNQVNGVQNSQNDTHPDYDPRDRNSNYRPTRYFSSSARRNGSTRYNFKRKYKNIVSSRPLTPSQVVNKTIVNSRNKGIAVTYRAYQGESVKIILNKIQDNLDVNMKMLTGVGWNKGQHDNEVLVYLFFANEEPYTKVSNRMASHEAQMFTEGTEMDIFLYEGPRSLNTQLANGELFMTTRKWDEFFAVKLSKPKASTHIVETLGALEEWQSTRHTNNPSLIMDIVHVVRFTNDGAVITFSTKEHCADFKDFIDKGLIAFNSPIDAIPTNVLYYNASAVKAKKRMVKVTPDILAVAEAISQLTPQSLRWFKQIATGRFGLIELPPMVNDYQDNSLAQNLEDISINNPLESQMEVDSSLPPPLAPNQRQ